MTKSKYLVELLLCCCTLYFVLKNTYASTGIQTFTFKVHNGNHAVVGRSYANFASFTRWLCVRKCIESPDCNRIAYKIDTNTCLLYDTTSLEIEIYTSVDMSLYNYNIFTGKSHSYGRYFSKSVFFTAIAR